MSVQVSSVTVAIKCDECEKTTLANVEVIVPEDLESGDFNPEDYEVQAWKAYEASDREGWTRENSGFYDRENARYYYNHYCPDHKPVKT